jgi:hypothetical protein
MCYSTILAELKTVLEGVNNIGNVYDYIRHVNTGTEEKRLFHKEGKLHVWMITRISAPGELYASGPQMLRKHNFEFWGYYGFDDSQDSKGTFQTIGIAVVNKLEAETNRNLVGDADIIEPVEFNIDEALFGPNKTLCHRAKIAFTVEELI